MQILTLFFRKDNCTFLFLYKARHCFQYEKSSFCAKSIFHRSLASRTKIQIQKPKNRISLCCLMITIGKKNKVTRKYEDKSGHSRIYPTLNVKTILLSEKKQKKVTSWSYGFHYPI